MAKMSSTHVELIRKAEICKSPPNKKHWLSHWASVADVRWSVLSRAEIRRVSGSILFYI